MRILTYVSHRLVILFLAVFGVSIITFVVTRVLPGNPAYLIVGVQADQSTVDAVIDKMAKMEYPEICLDYYMNKPRK